MTPSQELITKAKALGELLIADWDPRSFKYKVEVKSVVYREKKSHLNLPIYGIGFSFEDACYDYLRKARGGLMIHIISDKFLEVV